MSAQDKSIQYPIQMKAKWWYWPLLILGSVMVVGGIIGVIVLQKGQADEQIDRIYQGKFITFEMVFHVSQRKVPLFVGYNQEDGRWGFCGQVCGSNCKQVKGEQYAKLALDYYYYPRSFMAGGSGYPLPGWTNLYLTCHRIDNGNYLAGTASENQTLAPHTNITRLKQKHRI